MINVPETDCEDVVICLNEGCTKTFASNEELTNHLYSEKRTLVFNQIVAALIFPRLNTLKRLLVQVLIIKQSTSDSELDMGWALKDERKKQEV